jgi:L-alanine-DL-glutamate epimerase-like enolase superfamily enzyme
MSRTKITMVKPYMVDVPVKETVFPRKLPFGDFPGLVRIITEIQIENLENGTKTIGYGECPPTHPFTTETPLSVYELMENYVGPSLVGVVTEAETPKEMKSQIDHLIDAIKPCLKNLNMVLATTDHALHDVYARSLNIPVWKLLCEEPKRDRLKGCWSTSGDYDKSIEEARSYLSKGYAVKIKLFGDMEKDLSLTNEILALGEKRKDAFVCADANGSYTTTKMDEYIHRLSQLYGNRLVESGFFVEEPIKTSKDVRDELVRIINNSPVRIMLDESLVTNEDADYFIGLAEKNELKRSNLLFNIKIDKVGGLKAAAEIARNAKEHGIDIMIGGMFPSSYGKLVNCQFALGIENVAPSDGVHPSLDYVSTPIIKDIEMCEKMSGGYRDLSVFYNVPGMGAEIDKNVLIENSINISLPEKYLSRNVKARITELDQMKE